MSVVNVTGEIETEIKNPSEFWNEANLVLRTESLTVHSTLTLDTMKLLVVQLTGAISKIENEKISLVRG